MLLLSHFSRVQLCVTPGTVACWSPLSVEFSRPEYWNGELFPSPGDLPNPGILYQNLSVMQETWVWSLGWEDSPGDRNSSPTPVLWPGEFHGQRRMVGYSSCVCVGAKLFSGVRLCATPWTVVLQAPLPWDSPGKNIGLGCHGLFQGIFLAQGLNLRLLCLLH